MEKTIKAGNYEFPAKSTAASLFSYKSNFGRDGLRDLISLANSTGDGVNMESVDMDVFFRFLWVFAKASTPEIQPLEEWLDTFDVAPLDFMAEVLPQITELLGNTAKTSVKSKNSPAAVRKK